MIIIQFNGGLGNQMFQYAAGKYIEQKLNFKVKFDKSIVSIDPKRDISLDKFNIHIDYSTLSDMYGIIPNYLLYRIGKKIRRNLGNCFFEGSGKSIDSVNDNSLVYGYWHNAIYPNFVRNTLLNDFKLIDLEINPYYKKIIDSEHSISIHVRRGDYVTDNSISEKYGSCSLEYYIDSIKRLSVSKSKIFVFSDDIMWCKNNFTSDQFIFVENQTMNTDLLLMSKCNDNIISNSSFSWWSAWLNTNKQKRVIYPTPWHNKLKFDSNLICDTTWEAIQK